MTGQDNGRFNFWKWVIKLWKFDVLVAFTNNVKVEVIETISLLLKVWSNSYFLKRLKPLYSVRIRLSQGEKSGLRPYCLTYDKTLTVKNKII